MTAGPGDPAGPPEPAPPEIMSAGPSRLPTRTVRIVAIVAVVVALVAVGGTLGVRIYRQQTDLVSLAELKSTYAAFLAADGRNVVTEIDRPSGPVREDPDVPVTQPARCAPITDAAMQQTFPTTALDGVSTFQDGGFNYSVSLFSYRFADRAAAGAEFTRIADAAARCNHTEIEVSEPLSASLRVGLLTTTIADADATLDVELEDPQRDSSSFQITLARYKNVISWQYAYRSGAVASLPDHHLLQALVTRLAATDRVGR